jgi:hypothetical protein
MATATLTFNLADFDDRVEHLRCTKSTAMAMFIWNLVNNSKKSLKYTVEARQMKDETFDAYDAIDLAFERIYELLEEEGINIDDLIV